MDNPLLFLVLIFVAMCTSPEEGRLQPVTIQQFEEFVDATGYVTDAERLGWSIVQDDVFRFHTMHGADWRRPDGVLDATDPDLPVTQVSYNDALAYCEWSGRRLPSYAEYWELIAADERPVITENSGPISKVEEVNVLGNVWELTATLEGDSVRLAGGSIFCSEHTCHGTDPERNLWVDRQTGNIHIGFATLPLASDP